MNYKQSFLDLIHETFRDRNKPVSKDHKVCFMANNDQLFCISNQKYMAAKMMSEKLGVKVYVISNRYDTFRNKMTNAYGFHPVCLQREISPARILKSVLATFLFLCKYNDRTLVNAKIGGIHAGDLIYDTVIRQSEGLYTISHIFCKNVIKEIFMFYFTFYTFSGLMKKYAPDYFIAQDLVYRDGFVTRIANAMKAQVILLTTGRPAIVFKKKTNTDDLCFSAAYASGVRKILDDLEDGWSETVRHELEKLLAGEGDWNVKNAYKNKLTSSRKDILDEMGINNGKKNVVIMAHCFSDAPHISGTVIYKDYYEWLAETLKYASANDQVNWILKPHPGRYAYGESGVTERLFDQYRSDNLHWMPEKYSTAVIREIADCLVTVSGSAGYEMACFGIPCINAGMPFYSYFGYTIVCRTKEKYLRALDRAAHIKKLDKEKIEMAQKVYFATAKVLSNENDLFSDRCAEIHNSFIEDKDVEKANEKYTALWMEYCQKKELDSIYDMQFIKKFCEENMEEDT